ncbi:hypothetical protein GCM10009554_05450 [Kribbella koreensis]|uniref:Uncharacterized protein n=1 Tax=Kribbella koreensis TaxID=57909 RepID=A0ABN1PCW5_9ACTN
MSIDSGARTESAVPAAREGPFLVPGGVAEALAVPGGVAEAFVVPGGLVEAFAVPAREVEEFVLPAGAVGSQRTLVVPLRPWTARTAAIPPSHADVAGQRPRQRSVTVPSDHSTPSATVTNPGVPVDAPTTAPAIGEEPDGRTRWKSLGSGCGVLMVRGS